MPDPLQADGLELRYEQLRRLVLDRRQTAAELPYEHAHRSAALRALIEATDELLVFEDRLPVLLDQSSRALSVRLVRAGTLATALGAALAGLGIWRSVLAPWWIAAIIVLLLAAVRLVTLTIAPAAAARHRRQRYSALACGTAGLLLVPMVVLLGWWAGLLALVVLGLAQAALLDGQRRWL